MDAPRPRADFVREDAAQNDATAMDYRQQAEQAADAGEHSVADELRRRADVHERVARLLEIQAADLERRL
jgi:beta-xylosidase